MSAAQPTRRVAVVTGTRAEFGLLETVMRAVAAHHDLELQTIVTGAHLLKPSETWREVAESFDIAATVPMQSTQAPTRLDDASALGRGIQGLAASFQELRPDWVVVLGDRIEAFAAGAAASIGGIAVAHIHGGDRAEGVADEAMRHAITKLAHLHLPATAQSADRIERMGEDASRIHVVGSPAIDGLTGTAPLDDTTWRELGRPEIVILFHPTGRADEDEHTDAQAILDACAGRRTLALHPNHDPGRAGVLHALEAHAKESDELRVISHLPRPQFVGALKRLSKSGGVVVGNSSAGLIECAALRVPVVDIGPRQGGRERAGNVIHVESPHVADLQAAIDQACCLHLTGLAHPYGDGHTGERIAALLAEIDPSQSGYLRKRNAY